MVISSQFAAQLQKQQEKNLLTHAVQNLRLAEFGKKHSLKPGHNSKTVQFFRRGAASLTGAGAIASLTEGGQALTDRDITVDAIEATIAQFGQAAKVSDIVNNVALLDYVKMTVAQMGEEAALYYDTLIRNELAHPTTGLSKLYAQGVTTFNGLVAATAAAGKLVPSDILRCRTKLEIARAPRINGKYVMVVPPQVAHDILNNPEWREVIRHQNADKYFKGLIGELFGVMIVEATNPFREAATNGTEGTYDPVGPIYTSFVLGAEAFGCIDFTSLGGTPWKPQVIILDKPDKTDRLGQYISIGWKAASAQKVLNPEFGIALRSRTEYVG